MVHNDSTIHIGIPMCPHELSLGLLFEYDTIMLIMHGSSILPYPIRYYQVNNELFYHFTVLYAYRIPNVYNNSGNLIRKISFIHNGLLTL